MKKPQRIQTLVKLVAVDDHTDQRQKKILERHKNEAKEEGKKFGTNDEYDLRDWLREMAAARLRIEWWLSQKQANHSPRNKVIAFLCLKRQYTLAQMEEVFNGEPDAPGTLSGNEKELITALQKNNLTHASQPENVRIECPKEYEGSLRRYFGDAFENELDAFLTKPKIDIRVNTLKLSRADAKHILESEGHYTVETPYSPSGLRHTRSKKTAKRMTGSNAYNTGEIEFQDEGSQMIVELCDVKPGMAVLDYCAGAGGKTLALAAKMQNQGSILSADLYSRRLEKSTPRLERAGCRDIVQFVSLGNITDAHWLHDQKKLFDVVLTDVPCTGTGTWRRFPEMRWKLGGLSLSGIFNAQVEILENVAPLVREGGRLVYSTCSLLPEENEDRVQAFLAKHPEYKLVPVDEALGIGTPYMRMTPHRHKTDGFFAAVLERQPA